MPLSPEIAFKEDIKAIARSLWPMQVDEDTEFQFHGKPHQDQWKLRIPVPDKPEEEPDEYDIELLERVGYSIGIQPVRNVCIVLQWPDKVEQEIRLGDRAFHELQRLVRKRETLQYDREHHSKQAREIKKEIDGIDKQIEEISRDPQCILSEREKAEIKGEPKDQDLPFDEEQPGDIDGDGTGEGDQEALEASEEGQESDSEESETAEVEEPESEEVPA